jgi:hypothetical protein
MVILVKTASQRLIARGKTRILFKFIFLHAFLKSSAQRTKAASLEK